MAVGTDGGETDDDRDEEGAPPPDPIDTVETAKGIMLCGIINHFKRNE